jgi:hypothetical protein
MTVLDYAGGDLGLRGSSALSHAAGRPLRKQRTTRLCSPATTGTCTVLVSMRSRIEPMKKIAKTLRGHRELILNYFRAKKQFSSGVVEGLNNKVKLTMRKSYGFRTFHATELALYHALGKLPEPETTHRFY